MKYKYSTRIVLITCLLLGMASSNLTVAGVETSQSIAENSQLTLAHTVSSSSTSQEDATSTTVTQEETPEAIIGSDDQTTIADTRVYPYNSVVHIMAYYKGFAIGGSGVMIAPNLLLTVAHNVYDREIGSWANHLVVTPAKNGSNGPFGTYTATQYYVPSAYTSPDIEEEYEYDIAVVKLDSSVVSGVGFLPLATQVSLDERLEVPGYPAESSSKEGWMYTGFGTVTEITDKEVFHLADTEVGNSGSPILNAQNQVVAILSSEIVDPDTKLGEYNAGRRIDQDVLDMIAIARDNTALTDRVTSNKDTTIVPTGVALSPISTTLTVGTSTTLTATVSPSNATNQAVTWESSNPQVATVVDGQVTAMSPGEATITVTTAVGNKTATSQITVQAKPEEIKTLPVYRLYHAGLQSHLYTQDANEYKVLASRGWKQEGIAFTTAENKGDAVYRLYHSGLKVHLYTKDANEYKVLASRGWKQEGIASYSYGAVSVYRLYHAGMKKHLYTTDTNEYKVLASRGWKQEGVAFYAVK